MPTRPRRSPSTAAGHTPEYQQARRDILANNPDCALCGRPGADSIDHITPVALGGTNERNNLRPAHRSCNSAAGAAMGNRLRKRKQTVTNRNKAPQIFTPQTAPATGKPEKMGRKRTYDAGSLRLHPDGFVLPRLETPASRVAGSWGPEVADLIDGSGVLGEGNALRPWQRYVLDRALEVTDAGELRWPTVVLTVARQQGKSWLLRGLGYWRMHAADRFGEPQTVLHVANKSATAREAWEPAARLLEELHGHRVATRWGDPDAIEILRTAGRESLRLHDGSRWLVQAANQNAGVGFSVSTAIVDEAWNVKRDVVEVAISPTMSARNQPQLWLVSTAGDSASDLLRSYRDLATANPDGDVLLLEWSAPPEAKYTDPGTWRWASPEWDDRREAFLRSRVTAMPSAAFRSQYCNQWTVAMDGWLAAEVWQRCAVKVLAAPRKKDAPVVAVETSPLDQRVTLVAAWRRGEKVAVWSHLAHDLEDAWKWARSVGAVRLLLPPDLAVHYPGNPAQVTQVGTRELRTLLPGVDRAVKNRQVVYKATDEYLTSHVLSAVASSNHDGTRSLNTKKSPGPIMAARCMIWAVGEVLRPASPKPVVVAG